jgi:hypothetical protein
MDERRAKTISRGKAMTIAFLTICYPHPDHSDEFSERMRTAASGAAVCFGCRPFEEDQASPFTIAHEQGVDSRFDERRTQPRRIFWLTNVAPSSSLDRRHM